MTQDTNRAALPADVELAMVKACADFIGSLTGLIPPPAESFPPEMQAPFREFARRVFDITRDALSQSAVHSGAAEQPITNHERIELYELRDAVNRADGDAVCTTCNGHGMIGGPSYSDPGEGGVLCPDCNDRADGDAPSDAPVSAHIDGARDK